MVQTVPTTMKQPSANNEINRWGIKETAEDEMAPAVRINLVRTEILELQRWLRRRRRRRPDGGEGRVVRRHGDGEVPEAERQRLQRHCCLPSLLPPFFVL